MKLLSIVGARPNFTKLAVFTSAIAERVEEGAEIEHRILHTGQHYDTTMSDVFFSELQIPTPDINLGVGSGLHGAQTGSMLEGIERILIQDRPDAVVIYGDTNSTLAGALAAAKLHIPVVHFEAGMRSFNMRMPEEMNRVVSDHVSSLLLCPTQTAVENLMREHVPGTVAFVGDLMLDMVTRYSALATERFSPAAYGAKSGEYILSTLHRAENTDDPARMAAFVRLLEQLPEETLLPVHPRLSSALEAAAGGRIKNPKVHLLKPLSYLEMLSLQANARVILTDSGGVQKEAYFLGTPCITLRPETEWQETLEGGWNQLADMNDEFVLSMVNALRRENSRPSNPPRLDLFGNGNAATASLDTIFDYLHMRVA